MLRSETLDSPQNDKHSKEYYEALKLIFGEIPPGMEYDPLPDISNDLDPPITIQSTNKKKHLEDSIRALDKSIAKIDDEIANLKSEGILESLCCMLGCLIHVGGVVSIASGVADIGNGNMLTGGMEVASGALSMQVGNDFMDAAERNRDNISHSLSHVNAKRDELKERRTKKQKELYQIEKEETLNILQKQEKQTTTQPSPMILAVKNQFDAIDLDIKQGKFSKTYIDVAKNTKKIITAPNQEKRNEYAEQHVAITTKKSIPKIVGGCMLMVAGAALVITSAILAGVFLKTGIAVLAGAVGVVSGMALAVKGAQVLNSGMARERTPLVMQSLFKVVKAAKADPEMDNQYRNVKRI